MLTTSRGKLDGKLWLIGLISALITVVATHPPHLSPNAGSYACIPRGACIQLVEARMDKKNPVLQISGIFALITGCCF